jgi:hypothetical protein
METLRARRESAVKSARVRAGMDERASVTPTARISSRSWSLSGPARASAAAGGVV